MKNKPKKKSVCVIGLGFVGLTLAAIMSNKLIKFRILLIFSNITKALSHNQKAYKPKVILEVMLILKSLLIA